MKLTFRSILLSAVLLSCAIITIASGQSQRQPPQDDPPLPRNIPTPTPTPITLPPPTFPVPIVPSASSSQ